MARGNKGFVQSWGMTAVWLRVGIGPGDEMMEQRKHAKNAYGHTSSGVAEHQAYAGGVYGQRGILGR